jgi:hypothetical protein
MAGAGAAAGGAAGGRFILLLFLGQDDGRERQGQRDAKNGATDKSIVLNHENLLDNGQIGVSV